VIEAVTFDYWNTLVYVETGHLRGARLNAWGGILEEAGFAVERERLDAAFDRSWKAFLSAWKSGSAQYRAAEAAADIVTELGFDPPAAVRDELVESFGRSSHEADLQLTNSIAAALDHLRRAGVRIGIICDVGLEPSSALLAFLDRAGVLDRFDHWSFSDEVGVYKPDRRIFEHALAGLGGVAPERAAHVGDLRRTDVAGALAMGMTSVRYRGVADDTSQAGPEAHRVIDDHAGLADALRIPA
jgi:putative hydrolase of the HAD superfamily